MENKKPLTVGDIEVNLADFPWLSEPLESD